MFCINLCDIFSLHSRDHIKTFIDRLEGMTQKKVKRIYIGSYFCDRYFLNFYGYKELLLYCQTKKMHVTLVVPVFSQNTLVRGKKKILEICECFEGVIDEITVNDFGMLNYFKNNNHFKINLGRLFFKNPRDCRIPEYTRSKVAPGLISKLNQGFWKDQMINCIELDSTNQMLDVSGVKNLDVGIALHTPFCYMTTGKICKFASIHKNIDKKFRPNTVCQMECMSIIDTYTGHVATINCDTVIYRIGRTLFFESGDSKIIGKNLERLIYFPIKEWGECMHENFSSSK